MENLLDEEFVYEKIDNMKGLCYKINYYNQNISKDPKIKKFLLNEKLQKGDDGIISYCKKNNLLFYFQNEEEERNFRVKYYIKFELGHICKFCGQIYFPDSFCCIKIGLFDLIKSSLFSGEIITFSGLFKGFPIILILFLFFFIFILSFDIFKALYLNRRKTIGEDNFSSYDHYKTNSTFSFISFFLLLFLILIYTIIFSIPYVILYIIYIIVFLIYTIKKKK